MKFVNSVFQDLLFKISFTTYFHLHLCHIYIINCNLNPNLPGISLPLPGNNVKNTWNFMINLLLFQDLHEPQTPLLRYVLEQPYSRDMVCNMLSLNKQVSLGFPSHTDTAKLCKKQRKSLTNCHITLLWNLVANGVTYYRPA